MTALKFVIEKGKVGGEVNSKTLFEGFATFSSRCLVNCPTRVIELVQLSPNETFVR
jgi:hypothetical protein